MELVIILGLIAASLTSASFVPQAIKSIKTKHTKDISLGMYILSTTGLTLWLIYGILTSDFPIIAANIITVTLAAIILILKLKYK